MSALLSAACLQPSTADLFERIMGTERIYFEMGAERDDLSGATLAWTPGFAAAPAAAVVHRVDADKVTGHGAGWIARLEQQLAGRGIPLARIYLERRHERMESMLDEAGYVCREELMFTGRLPDPDCSIDFRPVITEADWTRKLAFHCEAPESPDGHQADPAAIAGLERHKCVHGMEAFSGEAEGRVLGVVGVVWGEDIVRVKNLVVHPGHRRRSVATALLHHAAALGRERGIGEQCLVALKGGAGEGLYRSMDMTEVGSCFEWSKRVLPA